MPLRYGPIEGKDAGNRKINDISSSLNLQTMTLFSYFRRKVPARRICAGAVAGLKLILFFLYLQVRRFSYFRLMIIYFEERYLVFSYFRREVLSRYCGIARWAENEAIQGVKDKKIHCFGIVFLLFGEKCYPAFVG